MDEYECDCGGRLEFVASLAAPGKGNTWKRTQCGKKYWEFPRGRISDFSEVDPGDVELSPRDVM